MLKHIKTESIPEAVKQFDNYPDSAFIRPNIAKILLGVSIATFWRLARSGQIKTYKLTERTTTVKVSDLRAFMAAKAGV
ncbi:MAG: transcriptional regulator [Methylotenera sp.]|nr:MAG: transcriptional regulator [Methylotenera sp.]